MKPFLTILTTLLVGVFLMSTCDDDVTSSQVSTPDPPTNIVGYPLETGLGLTLVLVWTSSDNTPVDGYNVYRRKGANAFEKLNDELVAFQPYGPSSSCPGAHFYSEINATATEPHTYYVTSVSGNRESDRSDSVVCDPQAISFDNLIGELNPAEDDNVEPIPVFDWQPISGAKSYLVWLMILDSTAYRLVWLHQCEQDCDTFKISPGCTYLDAINNTLREGTDYFWIVYAVDNNNCCFAFTDLQSFMTRSTRRLVWQYTVPSGKYRVCWDQKDDDGVQVLHGNYLARFWCNTGRDSVSIQIGDFPPTQTPDCDIDPEIATQINNLDVSATQLPPGDTLALDYEYLGRVCDMYVDIINDDN